MKNYIFILILLFGVLFLNAQETIPLRVNVGGGQNNYGGNVFKSDQYYSGGTVYVSSDTLLNPIHRSERWGNFSYDIPVENGYYNVVLHFIEIWMDESGKRRFDVEIENNLVLDNYDIFHESGNAPTSKTFNNVQVTDGFLNLVFTNIGSGGEVENPKLSGFEVLPSQGSTGGGNSGSWMFSNQNAYYTGGNVGIGTITPDEKLSVNGKIHTKEVRVDLVGWSDFVFHDDYDLPSLQEVENYIKEKGHLKDIPSAKEVLENGILVGDMNAKLLQKIEELTLYVIEQQKLLEKQNSKLEQQLRMINVLQESIEKNK